MPSLLLLWDIFKVVGVLTDQVIDHMVVVLLVAVVITQLVVVGICTVTVYCFWWSIVDCLNWCAVGLVVLTKLGN